MCRIFCQFGRSDESNRTPICSIELLDPPHLSVSIGSLWVTFQGQLGSGSLDHRCLTLRKKANAVSIFPLK